MARLGVTYQDVANAAYQLLMQDKSPTIELIRQQLGTGSSTTIANHLRQWRADQEGALSLPHQENVPKEMIGMLKGLWDRLSVQAEQKANEIEAKTKQEITELRQKLEKYQTNNRRWQQLFNQWQQERERLLSDKLMLEHTIQSQQTDIAVLNTKIDAQAEQMAEKQLRIEELHRLHQQSQANLEHYRESTREQRLIEQAQFEQQKQEMLQEVKVLREQLVLVKDKACILELDHKVLQQNYQSLQLLHHELETNYKMQAEQLVECNVTKSEQQLASQYWEKQYRKIEMTLDERTNQVVECQTANKVLLQQLKDSQISLNNQFDQVKQLSQEKWLLAQDKAQLEGRLRDVMAVK